MSCLLTEVQLRLRRRLSPDCYCTVVNWAACGAAHFIKRVPFFFVGGGGGGGGGGVEVSGISGKS